MSDQPEIKSMDPKKPRLSAVLEATALQAPSADNPNWVTFARVGVLAVLFLLLHRHVIEWMLLSWQNNANWSHGFLIPLFSLYLVYVRRAEIAAVHRRTCWAGLPIMILALAIEALSVPYLKSNWVMGLAMVMLLVGLVLFVGGPSLLRVTWLPIAFLALGVPLGESHYNRLAYPLQKVAAAGAVWIFDLFGIMITRTESNLSFVSHAGRPVDLTVVEACSGMRLLMAFLALGVATAYLESRPLWQRIVLVMAGVPIAIVCNVLRVIITASMHYYDKPEWGEGVLHAFTGMLMLIPAFAMLYAIGWILKHLIVEDQAGGDQPSAPAEGGAA